MIILFLLHRAEADGLNVQIEDARSQLERKPSELRHVEPYDLSKLLDENLEKERLYNEMKLKLFQPPQSDESLSNLFLQIILYSTH